MNEISSDQFRWYNVADADDDMFDRRIETINYNDDWEWENVWQPIFMFFPFLFLSFFFFW